MYPLDLEHTRLELPQDKSKRIVLCTGFVGPRANLRFQRFALRMQQAFPDQVVGWFANSVTARFSANEEVPTWTMAERQARARALSLRASLIFGCAPVERYVPQIVRRKLDQSRKLLRERRVQLVEELMLRNELEQLKRKVPAALEPQDVSELGGWKSADTVTAISSLKPYYLLSFGCSLLPKAVLETVSGVPVNQHSGWSPELRGGFTTEWAMYKDQPQFVGVTVHVTSVKADAGGILRRSWIPLHPNDEMVSIFVRTGVLGTELMLQAVEEANEKGYFLVFPQGTTGELKLRKDFSYQVEAKIVAADRQGWAAQAVANSQRF